LASITIVLVIVQQVVLVRCTLARKDER
jgi:hypothetical protein